MQMSIKPQDKTKPEKLELELHPFLIKRLREYARSLENSDVNYVLSQILEQVLPTDKAKKTSPDSTDQSRKVA